MLMGETDLAGCGLIISNLDTIIKKIIYKKSYSRKIVNFFIFSFKIYAYKLGLLKAGWGHQAWQIHQIWIWTFKRFNLYSKMRKVKCVQDEEKVDYICNCLAKLLFKKQWEHLQLV